MTSIDLYRMWPSIRRRSPAPQVAADKGRATTLDIVPGQEKARRADPNRVRDLLSQLVTAIEGRPLSDFVPMAQAIPLLIGLTPANVASFDEFLGSFIGTVLENGRTVEPGSVTSPSDSVSANRRFLSAKALGVKAAANVQRARPATARRFDDLMAMFSEGRTLAAVFGDGDDGLPPGTAEVVNSFIVAVRNNLKEGSPEGARQAGTDAGVLIAAIHGAFFTGEGTERSTRGGRTRRIAKNHCADSGYGPVLVRKSPESETSRALVRGVDVDGETVAIKDTLIDGRKFVRKPKKKA